MISKDHDWSVYKKCRLPRRITTSGVLLGKATNSIFKAAVRPNRNIYIGRTDTNVSSNDIRDFLSGANITVSNIECVSGNEAPNKAFKLTMPHSMYNRVFNEQLWTLASVFANFMSPNRNKNK